MYKIRYWWEKVAGWDWSLILIAVVAAVPRLYRPGMYVLWWDEVQLLQRSLRLAALHDWTWMSNRTTWTVIPIHSPFNTYAFALPYLVTHDPRAVRLLVGVLGVVAVIVLAVTVRRYFGAQAGLLSGLLLALAPTAVDWARWVWNPNLAQPFIALWLLTGLMGYYEGKRWAQVTHWLMLSFAGQAHLGHGFNMVPLSGMLLIAGWLRFPDRRRSMLRATALGWGLAALTLIPWGIGLLQKGIGNDAGKTNAAATNGDFGWISAVFSTVVSSSGFWIIKRIAPRPGDWWPPLDLGDRILKIKNWIALAGAAWLMLPLVWRRLRWQHEDRWQAFPGAFLGLVLLWPLVSFLVAPITVVDFYLLPVMFGAYAIMGVVLARLASLHRWARWPVYGLAVVFLVLQGWLLVGLFRWHDVGANPERFRASIDTYMNLLDDWKEASDEIVVLAETQEGKYLPSVQYLWWDVIGGYDYFEVVLMPQGVPIDPEGEVVVGSWVGTTIPTLFGEGEANGTLNDGQPMFRSVVIPAGYSVPLDYVPETLSRFANGAQILGIHAQEALEPGQPWPVVLAWMPDSTVEDAAQYQFSLRLTVGDTTYGQVDGASLGGWLWEPGHMVVNPFTIPAAADMPLEDVRVQVIMYSYPDMATVSVTDRDGNPVEPWLYLKAAMSD